MKNTENKINLPRSSKIVNGWTASDGVKYLFLIDSDSRIKSTIMLSLGLIISFIVIRIFDSQALVLLIHAALGLSLMMLKKGSYGYYQLVQNDGVLCEKVEGFDRQNLAGLQRISRGKVEAMIYSGKPSFG